MNPQQISDRIEIKRDADGARVTAYFHNPMVLPAADGGEWAVTGESIGPA